MFCASLLTIKSISGEIAVMRVIGAKIVLWLRTLNVWYGRIIGYESQIQIWINGRIRIEVIYKMHRTALLETFRISKMFTPKNKMSTQFVRHRTSINSGIAVVYSWSRMCTSVIGPESLPVAPGGGGVQEAPKMNWRLLLEADSSISKQAKGYQEMHTGLRPTRPAKRLWTSDSLFGDAPDLDSRKAAGIAESREK